MKRSRSSSVPISIYCMSRQFLCHRIRVISPMQLNVGTVIIVTIDGNDTDLLETVSEDIFSAVNQTTTAALGPRHGSR